MGYREFIDGEGTNWRAWDTYPGSAANVRPGFEGGWLGFECDVERRRLAPVPVAWEDASDDELRTMLSRAQPNRPARASAEVPEAAAPAPNPAPAPAPEPARASGIEGDGQGGARAVLERVRSVLSAVDRTLRG